MNTINNYSLPAALLLLTATTPLCAAEFSEDNWIGINGHPGVNDSVSATAVDASGNLYVAGGFTVAGDVSVTNIVKWDGSRWSALGSGMDYGVGLLAASGDELFAAGSYTTAGDKLSPNLARARIGSRARSLAASNGAATLRFSGVTGYSYDVQRTTSFTPPITWSTVTTTPLHPTADGFFTFTDTSAPPGSAFYRATAIDSDL